jgi:hypothetical protein
MTRLATAALVVISVITAAPASAVTPLRQVVDTIAASGGRYRYGQASLMAADCSGLVSVAQTLAMGVPVRRLGDTRSLMAGRWPDLIPGATPADLFIVATNATHMVAQVDGIGIESRSSGQPYRIGGDAASVFDPKFTRIYHVDERLLVA